MSMVTRGAAVCLLGVLTCALALVRAQTPPDNPATLDAWRQAWFAYEREVGAWCAKSAPTTKELCMQQEMAKHGVSPDFFADLRLWTAPSAPVPDDRRSTDDPDCAALGAAVATIAKDRLDPDKELPPLTDTEYRWYTDCPVGRAAWAQRTQARQAATAQQQALQEAAGARQRQLAQKEPAVTPIPGPPPSPSPLTAQGTTKKQGRAHKTPSRTDTTSGQFSGTFTANLLFLFHEARAFQDPAILLNHWGDPHTLNGVLEPIIVYNREASWAPQGRLSIEYHYLPPARAPRRLKVLLVTMPSPFATIGETRKALRAWLGEPQAIIPQQPIASFILLEEHWEYLREGVTATPGHIVAVHLTVLPAWEHGGPRSDRPPPSPRLTFYGSGAPE